MENTGGKERDDGWPPAPLIDQLVSVSGGLFIFAHTLCEFAAGAGRMFQAIIEDYATQTASDGNDLVALDRLYTTILSKNLEKLGGLTGH